MHVVHISAELAPVAKVGGLGDVVAGLTAELAGQGHEVTIILPKYGHSPFEQIGSDTSFTSEFEGQSFQNRLWQGTFNDCRLLLIDPSHPNHFFDRGVIYGCEDDLQRFLYFSRAAYDLLHSLDVSPGLIHLHDWPTAACALFKPLAPTCITIHNIAHQGKCSRKDFAAIGLDFPDDRKLLKEAIERVDAVTTVSPTYAREILTPAKGMGLERTLAEHGNKCLGILNGIDRRYWNPATDVYFDDHFSWPSLDGKHALKHKLRDELGLAQENCPLVGCISRLVPQKGVDLIKYGIHQILEKGGQVVILGNSPIPQIYSEFAALQQELATHEHISIILEHNEPLAHRIFGGSDMFIVPSLFEPCGLTQMIALNYGTIPIVRNTGGLADTIEEGGNGFLFGPPTTSAFAEAVQRAMDLWFKDKAGWQALMQRGMLTDFSWETPAKRYVELYRQLTAAPTTSGERC